MTKTRVLEPPVFISTAQVAICIGLDVVRTKRLLDRFGVFVKIGSRYYTTIDRLRAGLPEVADVVERRLPAKLNGEISPPLDLPDE